VNFADELLRFLETVRDDCRTCRGYAREGETAKTAGKDCRKNREKE